MLCATGVVPTTFWSSSPRTFSIRSTYHPRPTTPQVSFSIIFDESDWFRLKLISVNLPNEDLIRFTKQFDSFSSILFCPVCCSFQAVARKSVSFEKSSEEKPMLGLRFMAYLLQNPHNKKIILRQNLPQVCPPFRWRFELNCYNGCICPGWRNLCCLETSFGNSWISPRKRRPRGTFSLRRHCRVRENGGSTD